MYSLLKAQQPTVMNKSIPESLSPAVFEAALLLPVKQIKTIFKSTTFACTSSTVPAG